MGLMSVENQSSGQGSHNYLSVYLIINISSPDFCNVFACERVEKLEKIFSFASPKLSLFFFFNAHFMWW